MYFFFFLLHSISKAFSYWKCGDNIAILLLYIIFNLSLLQNAFQYWRWEEKMKNKWDKWRADEAHYMGKVACIRPEVALKITIVASIKTFPMFSVWIDCFRWHMWCVCGVCASISNSIFPCNNPFHFTQNSALLTESQYMCTFVHPFGLSRLAWLVFIAHFVDYAFSGMIIIRNRQL